MCYLKFLIAIVFGVFVLSIDNNATITQSFFLSIILTRDASVVLCVSFVFPRAAHFSLPLKARLNAYAFNGGVVEAGIARVTSTLARFFPWTISIHGEWLSLPGMQRPQTNAGLNIHNCA